MPKDSVGAAGDASRTQREASLYGIAGGRQAPWRPVSGVREGAAPAGVSTPVPLVQGAGRVASTVLAMAGWRLRDLNAVWVAGGVASIAFAHQLAAAGDWRLTVPYFLFTLLFYYGGNAAILSSRAPALLIARLGEKRAFRVYETVLGIMFLNQGLGVGCMAALPGWELVAPRGTVVTVAIGLFGVGLLVKLWATLGVGVDTFYYFDMFVDRAVGTTSNQGAYRFFTNPMYGIGQLQGYGYALFANSLAGVFAMAVGHVLIFAFYLLLERPFVRRVYPDHVAADASLPEPAGERNLS